MALPTFGSSSPTTLKPTIPYGARIGYYVDATTPTITELYNIKGASLPDPKLGVVEYGNLTEPTRLKLATRSKTIPALALTMEYDKAEFAALKTIKNNQVDTASADYGKKIYFIVQIPKGVGESGSTMAKKVGFRCVITDMPEDNIEDSAQKIHQYTINAEVETVTEEFI
jgi:hypothetical protein